MPDSAALSFCQLPLEILHSIFHYLDILDILRIRRVSRYLNGISHSRNVWSDAYRTAEFVRPPGPFLSQSAHDLENTLVPSFRVDRNLRQTRLTAQWETKAPIWREIRHTGLELGVSLVFGRFLLIAFREEIRCYDLNLDLFDSNSGASIIYRPTSATLQSFHCVSAIDTDGRPFACAVLSETTQTGFSTRETTQISIYLLNVSERSEVTLDLLHQFEHGSFDIEVVDLGPRVLMIQGWVGPDEDSDWRLIALDVHTRAQLLLPPYAHVIWEAPEMPEWTDIEEKALPTGVSTSTHLLLARSFYTQSTGWSTLLQAFTLPSPQTYFNPTSSTICLSPSYRGIVRGINLWDAVLLHDAILDSATQDVLITIRVYAFEPSRPRYSRSKWGVLCLSTANTSRGELGTITFRLLGSFAKFSRPPLLHPTFNGTGRAFYTTEFGASEVITMLEYDVRGDSGGDDDPVAKITEYPSIFQFPVPHNVLDYDPYCGRICLGVAVSTKYRVIQVVDLAV